MILSRQIGSSGKETVVLSQGQQIDMRWRSDPAGTSHCDQHNRPHHPRIFGAHGTWTNAASSQVLNDRYGD